jgi:AcrR family transcriptional regulator
MLKSKPGEASGRGSLEGWLRAAYENLVESGIDAVRIAPLSERLNLSRTSFYWFFKDRDELLAALIDQWRNKNTRNLIAQADAYAESLAEAILNVFDCWLDPDLFDSRFEFAVRGWAQRSASVWPLRLCAVTCGRQGPDGLPDPDRLHLHANEGRSVDPDEQDSRLRGDIYRAGTARARTGALLLAPRLCRSKASPKGNEEKKQSLRIVLQPATPTRTSSYHLAGSPCFASLAS